MPTIRILTEAGLGGVAAGRVPGRIAPDRITIADLTETGVLDTAAATPARERAAASGAGTDFSN
jgi:ornithine cyclodeaminase